LWIDVRDKVARVGKESGERQRMVSKEEKRRLCREKQSEA